MALSGRGAHKKREAGGSSRPVETVLSCADYILGQRRPGFGPDARRF